MILLTGGGGAWLLQGGACVVAPGGGMHSCSRGGAWFLLGGMHGFCWEVCMVFAGGHVWFLPGGMHGFSPGGCIGYDEIRSMSGRYASYWNAFLLFIISLFYFKTILKHKSGNLQFPL